MLSYFINTQKFNERKIDLCHKRKLQSSGSSCGTTNVAMVVAFFFSEYNLHTIQHERKRSIETNEKDDIDIAISKKKKKVFREPRRMQVFLYCLLNTEW